MKKTVEDLFSQIKEETGMEMFSFLADAVPKTAVFLVDKHRDIVFWSKGAEELLGYTSEDALGEHCLKVNRCVQCMSKCGLFEHKKVQDVQLKIFNKVDNIVPIRKTARAFFGKDGEFLGGIEILYEDRSPKQTKEIVVKHDEIEEFFGITSREKKMKQLFQVARNIAKTDTTILLRGESGTGKDMFAKAIHELSSRSKHPFVIVNCAAISPNLLESELFGHVKGAFTGAIQDRKGVFSLAHKGTLFLDEVAELPFELQAKLLRVIEQKKFTPVGGEKELEVDVRIISATHKSLRKLAGENKFREDLLFRLRVVPLFIPPLRDRTRDIPVLFQDFLQTFNKKSQREVNSVDPLVLKAIYEYDWPGNVRELRNVVEYAYSIGTGVEITLDQLPPEFQTAPKQKRSSSQNHQVEHYQTIQQNKRKLIEDEKLRIEEALKMSQGHLGKAAEMLGMSRPTLWRRRKKYNI